ncbi:Hypothetical protein BJL86_2146 [Dietzia timorensis]|uniref:Uncharacterized protein n=2 Tax=Dietzia timorensis TaxID=499555 RepID=A0A173LLZ2_9ACTN|nr:hypothetical protein [Dietzia timorensis]ANI92913.1 Hypothetical protein BJL86_2146 [Dietzia timorensis]
MMNSEIGPDAELNPEMPRGTELFVAQDIGSRTSRKVAGEIASQAESAHTRQKRKVTDLTAAPNLRSFLGRASALHGTAHGEETERIVRATLELLAESASTGQHAALKAEFPDGFFPDRTAGSETSGNA